MAQINITTVLTDPPAVVPQRTQTEAVFAPATDNWLIWQDLHVSEVKALVAELNGLNFVVPYLTTDLGGAVPTGPTPSMWIDDTASPNVVYVWDTSENSGTGGYLPVGTGTTPPATSGQAEYTTSGTFSWVAPAGVTSVSVVAVGGSSYSNTNFSGDSYFIDQTTVLAQGGWQPAAETNSVGDGGGDGGSGGLSDFSGTGDPSENGGGGGAGGYSGAGGNGQAYDGSQVRTDGTGGGGAGGGVSGHGGGVGIYGEGASGVGPSAAGSGGAARLYGGGEGGDGFLSGASGSAGGALRYKNDITVVPGNSYTIVVGAPNGAVRIIWPGDARQFPSTRTADE